VSIYLSIYSVLSHIINRADTKSALFITLLSYPPQNTAKSSLISSPSEGFSTTEVPFIIFSTKHHYYRPFGMKLDLLESPNDIKN
jgi:hypothetical protein